MLHVISKMLLFNIRWPKPES